MGDLGPVILVLILAGFWFGVHWILGPLHRAGSNRECRAQFSLADFMCLFFLAGLLMGGIQSVLKLFAQNRDSVPDGLPYCTGSLAMVAAALAWWSAVWSLSRANVRQQWQRLFVLVVAVPFAYLGPIAAVVLILIGLSAIPSALAACLLLGGSAVASAVFVSGILTRRFVASVAQEEFVGKTTGDQNAKQETDNIADCHSKHEG
jgi:hypothetical protein